MCIYKGLIIRRYVNPTKLWIKLGQCFETKMFPRKDGGGRGGGGTISKAYNYFIFNQPKKKSIHIVRFIAQFYNVAVKKWHVTASLCSLTKKYQIHLIMAPLSLNPKVFRIALQTNHHGMLRLHNKHTHKYDEEYLKSFPKHFILTSTEFSSGSQKKRCGRGGGICR